MRSFSDYNPIVVAIYFLAVSGIAMFCMHPILLLLSFLGAFFLYILQKGTGHGFFFLLFIGSALINPLFTHNGVTVLFVINDSPITLEATIYGITAAFMLISVLYWFRSFSHIMTSDKLLYVFSRLSPKLSLVLSMGLRYVPLLQNQAKKIKKTQIALGLYKEDNIIDRIRGKIRIFSIMVTWALENGIITADSMAARGYGIGKRSRFSLFRFRASDLVFLIVILLFSAVTLWSIGVRAIDFIYYPAIKLPSLTVTSVLGYCAYGLLCFLPILIETEVYIKWKYLQSKI